MVDVFISYARSDYDLAIQIKEKIEALGLTVYFDVEGLDGGDVFPDVLDEAVKTASAIVGVWTPHSLTRPWVKTECLIGKDRRCLIPVVVEPVAPLDVPAAFYGLQTIDLTTDLHDHDSRGHKTLVRSLSRTLKRPDLMRPAQPSPQPSPPRPEKKAEPTPRPAPVVNPAPRPTPAPVNLTPLLPALALFACGPSFFLEDQDLPFILTAEFLALAAVIMLWAAAFTSIPRWPLFTVAALLFVSWRPTDSFEWGGFGASAAALVLMFNHVRDPAPPLSSQGRMLAAAGAVALIALAGFLSVHSTIDYVVTFGFLSAAWLTTGLLILAVLRLPLWMRLGLMAAGVMAGIVLGLVPQATVMPEDAFNVVIGGRRYLLATLIGSLLTLALAVMAAGEQTLSRKVRLGVIAAAWIWLAFGSLLWRGGDALFAPMSVQRGEVVITFGPGYQPIWLLSAMLAIATGREFPARPVTLGAALAGASIAISLVLAFTAGNRPELGLGLAAATFAGVWLGSRLEKPRPALAEAAAL